MNEIGISVVIPVYNNESYLRECVDSVLNQDYTNFEIVLIDDGATDNSGVICDEYNCFPNIKIVHQRNQGQIAARLKGVHFSQKEIVVFLDSDDKLVNGSLKIISEVFMETNSDCVIFDLLDMDLIKSSQVTSNYSIKTVNNKHDFMMMVFLNQDLNSMCRKAVKRYLTDSINLEEFYHIRMGEDLVHSVFVLEKCKSVAFIDAVLYEYRKNSDSISQTFKRMGKTIDYSVEEFVLTYITNRRAFFNNTDVQKYLEYLNKLLYNKIVRILMLDMDSTYKEKLFNELWNSRFYQCNLRNFQIYKRMGKKESIVLTLFKYNMFNILMLFGRLYHRRKKSVFI